MCDYICMNIPKTIVQTWISEDKLTPVMKAATQTWKDKNPTWDYKFFSDEDCLEFIENNFPKDTVNAYNKIKPGAGKADLFRYCYLLVNGGVYTDIDNVCIKPLDNWLTDVDKFVGILDLPFLLSLKKIGISFIKIPSLWIRYIVSIKKL